VLALAAYGNPGACSQKKLFFNLRRLNSRMQLIDEGDPRPQQVVNTAKTLDVPERRSSP
jgi:RNA polymerase sigma-32 factor